MRVSGNVMSRRVAGYVRRLRGLKTLGWSPRWGVLVAHYGPIWWHTQTDSGGFRGCQHVPTVCQMLLLPCKLHWRKTNSHSYLAEAEM